MLYQVVVATKKAVNLTLPVPVLDELERIAKALQPKQKWMAHTAAMLLLIEAPEWVRSDYIRRAGSADIAGGSFDELIRDLKAGRVREDVERRRPEVPTFTDPVDHEQDPAEIARKRIARRALAEKGSARITKKGLVAKVEPPKEPTLPGGGSETDNLRHRGGRK